MEHESVSLTSAWSFPFLPGTPNFKWYTTEHKWTVHEGDAGDTGREAETCGVALKNVVGISLALFYRYLAIEGASVS